MKLLKYIFFSILIFGISCLVFVYTKEKLQPPFYRNFSVFFQEIGKPFHSINRSISKVLPIEDIDEQMLASEISEYMHIYEIQARESQKEYLKDLLLSLTKNCKKKFPYKIFIVYGPPNAFALPGGIICITNELLELISSEAELVSILGHEIGHIEHNHLFDACRGEMLRQKKSNIAIISFAIETFHIMSKMTFNKTQEDEADEFGFRLLLSQGYAPIAFSNIFQTVASKYPQKDRSTLLVNDFSKTHPDLEVRISKFKALAENWLAKQPNFDGYIGRRNYYRYISAYKEKFPEEFSNYKVPDKPSSST